MLNSFLEHADRPVYLLNAPLLLCLQTNPTMTSCVRSHRSSARSIEGRRSISGTNSTPLASQGLVYLVPSLAGLQDQVFVANLALRLHHLHGTVVVSNFRSPPRTQR